MFKENTKDMNFPVLTPAVINVSNIDFKKVKEKKNNKKTKNVRWVKLYYENGKIVKKYGLVRKDPSPPRETKSIEEKFSETIVKMRENWELYNEVHGYDVDYDYYNDQNEYESDTELNNYNYDDLMNEELIDSMYTRDD